MLETAIHYEVMQTRQSNNTQEEGDDEPGLEGEEHSPGTQKVVTHTLVYEQVRY